MLKRLFSSIPSILKLDEVVNLSALEKETSQSITSLWNNYHQKAPDMISTVISSGDLDKLNSRIAESSIFLYPIRRKNEHFLMISQSVQRLAVFSNFDEFERNPEECKANLMITFFDELKESKGIVPAKGDIMDSYLSKQECEMLLKKYLDYYLIDHLYHEHIYKFNSDPENFNHAEYINSFFFDLNKE